MLKSYSTVKIMLGHTYIYFAFSASGFQLISFVKEDYIKDLTQVVISLNLSNEPSASLMNFKYLRLF